MSQTYQICEVLVTLPPLGTITTDGYGNKIKHGDKCHVHLYAVKPDWRSGSTFEGFIVGWFTHEGYSESPHKSSQKIMMPDGYKLVAISVDEYGLPESWDSLPVHFAGGFISVQVEAHGTSNKAMPELSEVIRNSIRKECEPGGLIWKSRGR